jgi:hypothetical protein
MPGNLTANRVLSGRLAGFTKAQVEALWTAYQADPFASVITAASINGQSLSFGQGLGSAEKSRIIRDALAQVDPGNWSSPGQTIAVRFGPAC